MTTMLKFKDTCYADYRFDPSNNSVWSISLARYLKWSKTTVPTVTLARHVNGSYGAWTRRTVRTKFRESAIRDMVEKLPASATAKSKAAASVNKNASAAADPLLSRILGVGNDAYYYDAARSEVWSSKSGVLRKLAQFGQAQVTLCTSGRGQGNFKVDALAKRAEPGVGQFKSVIDESLRCKHTLTVDPDPLLRRIIGIGNDAYFYDVDRAEVWSSKSGLLRKINQTKNKMVAISYRGRATMYYVSTLANNLELGTVGRPKSTIEQQFRVPSSDVVIMSAPKPTAATSTCPNFPYVMFSKKNQCSQYFFANTSLIEAFDKFARRGEIVDPMEVSIVNTLTNEVTKLKQTVVSYSH